MDCKSYFFYFLIAYPLKEFLNQNVKCLIALTSKANDVDELSDLVSFVSFSIVVLVSQDKIDVKNRDRPVVIVEEIQKKVCNDEISSRRIIIECNLRFKINSDTLNQLLYTLSVYCPGKKSEILSNTNIYQPELGFQYPKTNPTAK